MTIKRVDRRMGSRRCTGTDMYPTNALCVWSEGSTGASDSGALNPGGTGLATVGLTSVGSVGWVMTGPGRRSRER